MEIPDAASAIEPFDFAWQCWRSGFPERTPRSSLVPAGRQSPRGGHARDHAPADLCGAAEGRADQGRARGRDRRDGEHAVYDGQDGLGRSWAPRPCSGHRQGPRRGVGMVTARNSTHYGTRLLRHDGAGQR